MYTVAYDVHPPLRTSTPTSRAFGPLFHALAVYRNQRLFHVLVRPVYRTDT